VQARCTDTGDQGVKTRANKVYRRGQSRRDDATNKKKKGGGRDERVKRRDERVKRRDERVTR
jgi:hypothetical protein